jgi:hypothetical protein
MKKFAIVKRQNSLFMISIDDFRFEQYEKVEVSGKIISKNLIDENNGHRYKIFQGESNQKYRVFNADFSARIEL